MAMVQVLRPKSLESPEFHFFSGVPHPAHRTGDPADCLQGIRRIQPHLSTRPAPVRAVTAVVSGYIHPGALQAGPRTAARGHALSDFDPPRLPFSLRGKAGVFPGSGLVWVHLPSDLLSLYCLPCSLTAAPSSSCSSETCQAGSWRRVLALAGPHAPVSSGQTTLLSPRAHPDGSRPPHPAFPVSCLLTYYTVTYTLSGSLSFPRLVQASRGCTSCLLFGSIWLRVGPHCRANSWNPGAKAQLLRAPGDLHTPG